ncbi:MAG: hypothetical protein ACE5QW_02630 [Thermoplasmata archaeon]
MDSKIIAEKLKEGRNTGSALKLLEDRKLTDMQIDRYGRFREGVFYAKAMLEIPEKRELYEEEAGGKMSAYNTALKDYLTVPTLLEVDISEYSGMPGEEIRVKGLDDVLVTGVEVAIIADGEILEQGDASQDEINKLLWIYRTQEENGHERYVVRVTATDLPGNMTVGEIES